MMLSKKWLINILLAGLAVFIGFQAYDAWSRKAAIPPDAGGEGKLQSGAPLKVAVKDPVAASTYDLVVEKNLFAPEREEIIPVEPKAEPEKASEKKPSLTKADQRAIARLALIGIVLSDNRKTALIRGGRGKGPGAGIRWVVEGDEVEGMRVIEIRDEKVLLTSGNTDVEILLYDPEKPKKRAAVKKEGQPTVVSTGGAAAGSTAEAPKKKTAGAPKKKTIRPETRAASAKAPILKLPVPRKKNPT